MISTEDITLTEGTGTTNMARFKLSVCPRPPAPVAVRYQTEPSVATENVDYARREGTLRFGPGLPLTQTVSVPINADDRYDGDFGEEFFTLRLSSSDRVLFERTAAYCRIVDDDLKPVFGIQNNAMPEGAGTNWFPFTLRLSTPNAVKITGT